MGVKRRDDTYPLQPLSSHPLGLQADGSLQLMGHLTGNVLLEIQYHATGREPCVEMRARHGEPVRQFFGEKGSGRRYLNLSGLSTGDEALQLQPFGCRIDSQVTLLQFSSLPMHDGPLLIVAPHADDAELAAYGLYRKYAEQTWIVTVSPGERLQSMKRQYVPGLDATSAEAMKRKGLIRAWNSATTPLLAGVQPERLIMLGYFDAALRQMMDDPSAPVATSLDTAASPACFRKFNKYALPSDGSALNRGEDLISDLVTLIRHIRPAAIITPHPELDPHAEHLAATQAVACALSRIDESPPQILLYANHFSGVKRFPYGPEHAAATLPPAQLNESILGPWSVHSECLSLAVQQEKIVALDTMHDLRRLLRPEVRLKQLWVNFRRKWPYRYYGANAYFQTAIKAHEVFAVVSGEAFVGGMLQTRTPKQGLTTEN